MAAVTRSSSSCLAFLTRYCSIFGICCSKNFACKPTKCINHKIRAGQAHTRTHRQWQWQWQWQQLSRSEQTRNFESLALVINGCRLAPSESERRVGSTQL